MHHWCNGSTAALQAVGDSSNLLWCFAQVLQLARQGRLKIVYIDTLWVQIPPWAPNCCSADNPVDGY